MNGRPIQYIDLHAFVDGELDPDRRLEVDDHLLKRPDHAALVEGWRRQNAALHAAFEPVALEATPASLRDAARRAPSAVPGQGPIETGAVHWGRPRAGRSFETRAAGRRKALVALFAMLLVVAAIGAGLVLLITSRAVVPVAVAAQGYAFRAGVTYATYADGPRLVEFDSAARGGLIAALREGVGFGRLPELEDVGFKLLGGRVVPGVLAPAGFLFYEGADGRRLGLYFERAEGTAMGDGARPNMTSIEWRANGYAFVLVGRASTEAMQPVAERAAASVAGN